MPTARRSRWGRVSGRTSTTVGQVVRSGDCYTLATPHSYPHLVHGVVDRRPGPTPPRPGGPCWRAGLGSHIDFVTGGDSYFNATGTLATSPDPRKRFRMNCLVSWRVGWTTSGRVVRPGRPGAWWASPRVRPRFDPCDAAPYRWQVAVHQRPLSAAPTEPSDGQHQSHPFAIQDLGVLP